MLKLRTTTTSDTPIESSIASSKLLTRQEVADRWNCCIHTIARDHRLVPIRFNQRRLRYRLEDVLRVEAQASIAPRANC